MAAVSDKRHPGWWRVEMHVGGGRVLVREVPAPDSSVARRAGIRTARADGAIASGVADPVAAVTWIRPYESSDWPGGSRGLEPIAERMLVVPYESRIADAPVSVETSGEWNELIVIRMNDETVVLNEAEAIALVGAIRDWRRHRE